MEISAQEKIQLKLGISPLRGTLGDANGVVYEPGRPGFYRVRYAASNGTLGLPSFVRLRPGIALNPKPGLPVLIGLSYDDQFEIIGGDATRAIEAGFNLVQQNPADPFNKPINQNQITTAFSHQTQIPSKSVVVKPWIFIEGGDIKSFLGTTVDLTSFIPATGYHCFAVLVLQSDMTIAVYPSTDKLTTEDLTHDEDIQEAWTDAYAADSSSKPLWAWRLHDDQSVITDADRLFDFRQIINSSITSSATAAPPDATYIVQTPNSTLTNEQALSSLATGYVKNTTGTGVLSVQAAPIPVADGGTGASTLTANNVLLGNGTSALQVVAPGTNRNALISNGTTWQSRALVFADLPAIAHSGLTGLTSGDDHTQYTLLAGRATGQTLYGGTASGESLTLNSTADATKGNVVVAGFATFKEASTQLVLTAGSKIMPASNSTTAIQIANAAGTAFTTFDTTNSRIGVGLANPASQFTVSEDIATKVVWISQDFANSKAARIYSGANGQIAFEGSSTLLLTLYPTLSRIYTTLTVMDGYGITINTSDTTGLITTNSPGNPHIIMEGAFDYLQGWNTGKTVQRFVVTSSGIAKFWGVDTATNAVLDTLTISHNSSNTPAAGFGTGQLLQGQSSTTTNRDMGRIVALWDVATDASRSSDLILYAYYTSTAREGFRIRGGSSNAQIGFLGATPISQYSTTGTTSGFTAGAGSTVDSAATFTGNTGSTAYTIGDIVRALKQYGLLTA